MPGKWTNAGKVIESGANSNWNAIDPNLVILNNQWYLSMGSFWSGIKIQEISSTGATKGSLYSIATRPSSVGGAIEGSTIYQTGGYYYVSAFLNKG
jgi:arabinan endo-1,5-alpha-L-arabinosidase